MATMATMMMMLDLRVWENYERYLGEGEREMMKDFNSPALKPCLI